MSSISSKDTETIGEQIGSRLKGGEVIELISDLGGGKTTFVHGLARGAKSTDSVASPTFTLSKVYETPRFEIHHFDFYRLSDPGLTAHELEDLVGDPQTVVVVEWADNVRHVLPAERLSLHISPEGDDSRLLTFTFPKVLRYLLKD